MKLAGATAVLALGALAGYATSTAAPQAAPPRTAVKEQVERVIHDSIEWALDDKNTDKLFGSVAHDGDFFIFHPDSRSTVVGFEAFRSMAESSWLTPDFRATSSAIRELRVSFSRRGDVAWFSALLDDCGEWQGRLGCWKDTRWTGVLEQRDGRWVIVQMHFSFAFDKKPDGTAR